MASPVYPTQTTVNGAVTAVNPKGIKLSPQDEWFNLSRWAEDVTMPERGQEVTLTLDKSGFVRGVATASCAPLPVAGGSDAPVAPSTKEGAAPQIPDSVRHRTITRLAVLKAAAEFGASKSQSSSGDVLKIAASWERWVLRSDDPTEDTVDAF